MKPGLPGPRALGGSATGDVPAPLSYAQQRMWFFNQLEPSSPLYNLPVGPLGGSSRPCASRWIGRLDLPALERSLTEILRRHQVLRTRFPLNADGVVIPEVMPAKPFHLSVEDFTRFPAAERSSLVGKRVDAVLRQPFDLTAEPPFRAVLLRRAEDEHVLAAVVHHIAFDRWSRGILLRELALLYSTYAHAKVSPLTEPLLQYQDYARWQRERVEGGALAADLAYWQEQLQGAPEKLELLTDHPRPAFQSHAGDFCAIPLAPNLVQRLEGLGRSERASLSMVLLSALQAQLSAYTGQTDISVGLEIAGRTQMELEELVGCFTNTLVLRTILPGDPTFRALVRQVRTHALKAYSHQELPFEKLVEELRPKRNPAYHPFFQVLFNYLDVPRRTERISGLELLEFEVSRNTAFVDLSVEVERTEAGTTCYFTYDVSLFDRAVVAELAEDYRALLEAAAAAPDRPFSTLTTRHSRVDLDNTGGLLARLEEMSEEEAQRAVDDELRVP
jgi:Condensation domain